MQHLGHGATCDIGALLGQATVGEVAAGMFAVSHVHVGDDVDDAAVGLLGQAFVLAAVAGFHVEDGDMEALGADDAEATVRVAQDKHCVRLDFHHELVALGDDIAHGFAQVVADGIHIDLGVGKLQVFEEDAVEVVVVVLASMGQDAVKVLTAFVDDGSKTDNLRPCAYDNQQF